jgi:hypothetical protein
MAERYSANRPLLPPRVLALAELGTPRKVADTVPAMRLESLVGAVLCVVLALAAPALADDRVPLNSKAAVNGNDLPTVRDIAASYPDYARGTRHVRRSRTVQVFAANCVSFAPGPRARSGRWAFYRDAEGESPYSYGGVGVGVFAFEFPRRARALLALRALRRDVARCDGTHRADGLLRRRARTDVPTFGTARPLAWSEYFRERYSGDDVFVDRARYLWTVNGRFLVRVHASRETAMPRLRPLVRLARNATRIVR